MTFDSVSFARKYAIKLTGLLAVMLTIPLILYWITALKIDKMRIKLALENQVERVIVSMDDYNNNDKVYTMPDYPNFDTALYSQNFEPIFSTLNFEINNYSVGFYIDDENYYIIFALPKDYYFESSYLVVSTTHEANGTTMFVLLGILLILISLFVLSLILLKDFSKPFKEINHKLDNFIKDSMHEINTPLSIININADLFANKYGDNKYLQRMKSASKTLATIYDDMDYLIKQGRVEHKIKNIDLSDFIQNRIEYFKGISNLKQILIETEINSNIYYNFSKTKLQRIVDNTISNAIKYSYDDNTVKIKLYEKNGQIIFSVQDYGVGIANLEKIFSRYYRENKTKGGFGIGLNIVKDIIDEEGIDLKVHSKVEKGTIFTYTFPLQNNLSKVTK